MYCVFIGDPKAPMANFIPGSFYFLGILGSPFSYKSRQPINLELPYHLIYAGIMAWQSTVHHDSPGYTPTQDLVWHIRKRDQPTILYCDWTVICMFVIPKCICWYFILLSYLQVLKCCTLRMIPVLPCPTNLETHIIQSRGSKPGLFSNSIVWPAAAYHRKRSVRKPLPMEFDLISRWVI